MSNSEASNDKQIVFDLKSDGLDVAQQALEDEDILHALIESLGDSKRRIRQFSAAALRQVAVLEPERLIDFSEDLVDALYRPEAQTRWEILETLVRICEVNSESAGDGFEAAQDALYDETSGTLRLAAFNYFVHLGTLSEKWSEKVWPLIDESLQVYHGDTEFPDMLTALFYFTKGDISDEVRQGIVDRLDFDATQGKGYIQKQSQAIIDEINKDK